MTFAPRTQSPDPSEITGGRLVTADGRALPLTGASLLADAKGGVIRVTLEQTFRNPHDEPLRVTYSLPLPADGAVSGFAFRIGEERVVGQVDAKARARQRFEDAVLEGRTAAILDQERSSLFTQEVGNVPPRTEVVCELQLDQKLIWLPDGAWEWRFPTVVAPRYMGAPGTVADVAKVIVDVADGALPVKLSLGLSIRDVLAEGVRPESPSHPLHSGVGLGRTDVTFGDERGVRLDRDVVVRWRVAQLKVGTSLDVSRPASGPNSTNAFGLLTLVPPSAEARMTPVPRDLIVLLDTSGSMSGMPLDQARRVTAALVDSLGDDDQLELIEFSNTARRWKRGAVKATVANRRDAQAWLARLQASGGTEMRTGILEALAPLRPESLRQVILITDGLIGFESQVLEAIARRLPRGSRVHTVGVGSGVNRSLTLPAARAGRGVELVIGLGEDVEPFVKRLMARTHQPLLTEVEVSGSAVISQAPARVPDLFGGSPSMSSLKLRPEGGELIVRARSADGEIEERVQVPAVAHGEGSAAVTTLFGRELVEDFELNLATGGHKAEFDPQIERTGIDFQISTRLTSWVAISAKQTVDPRAPKRSETMPHELAYGLSAEGVGLRQSSAVPRGAPAAAAPAPMRMSMGRSMMKVSSKDVSAREEQEEDKKSELSTRTGGWAPSPEPERMRSEESADEDQAPAEFADDEGSAGEADRLVAPPPPAQSMPGAPPARPAAPPPPAKKKEGLLDFARRLLKPKSDEAPAPEAEPKPEPKPESRQQRARHPNTRRLFGRVRRQGGRLIIEIDVAAALTWAPGPNAELEFADGSFGKVPVDAQFTTAPGAIGAGLTLTLVLTVSEASPAPAMVHLSNGGEVLEIVL